MKRRLLAALVFASVAAQSPEDRFRAELQTKAIEQPVADGVRVVVHAGDGGPLAAGADILVICTVDWSGSVSQEYHTAVHGARAQWTMARHRMLLRFGRRWRTDDGGESLVPADAMMWGAVRGDLWAFAPHWNNPTIVLRPRLRVPVRVVAADASAVFDHPRTCCDANGSFVLRGLMPRLEQIGLRAHRPRDLAQCGEGMFDVGASDVRVIVR